jgi:hypothetical protein
VADQPTGGSEEKRGEESKQTRSDIPLDHGWWGCSMYSNIVSPVAIDNLAGISRWMNALDVDQDDAN